MQRDPYKFRFLIFLGILVWAIACPIIWVSLFYTNFNGDLTRIGQWREADFYPQITQDTYLEKPKIYESLASADILVIGDSFSEGRVWQSFVESPRFSLATLTWSQIGEVCADFVKKIREAGFSGKTIIIESVERLTVESIEKSINCASGKKSIPSASTFRHTSKTNEKKPDGPNLSGQYWVGIKVLFHSAAIRLIKSYYKLHNWKSKGTHVYPIDNGCDFFSNRMCDYGLFYYEDYHRPAPNIETINKIKKIDDNLKDYRVIWLIIPNKSSIYQKATDHSFWERLESSKLGPNLYTMFENKKIKIRDLYKPNDSHLSIDGYRYLSRIVLKELEEEN